MNANVIYLRRERERQAEKECDRGKERRIYSETEIQRDRKTKRQRDKGT